MFIFTFLFIIIFLFQFISTEVVIPFKQISRNEKEPKYNSSLFLDDNLLFIPITSLNIGNPSKKIFFVITQNISDITFHKKDIYILNNEFNYSPLNSDSCEIIKEINNDKNQKQFFLKDDIELYEDINLNKKIKSKIMFNFIKDNSNKYNNHLFEIGFPLNKNLDKLNSSSFIYQLKSSSKINNYKISLHFNSYNSGFYLIGNYPHYFIPNNFSEYQLISTYSIPNNPSYQFQIIFDEVYISNISKINLDSKKIYFNLDLGLIKATKEYFDQINKLFFDEYYKNKICKKEVIYKNIYDSGYAMNRLKNYEVISCIKNGRGHFNIELFPSICFYHREMNFSFCFDFSDLFEEKNGIYYFKIIKTLNEDKEWQFGKTFFEKYSTTFDIESRKMYFYNKNILIKHNTKGNNEKTNLLIVICILLSIILIVISFFLGKKIYQQRKLRKNELDDNNYDYKSSLSEEVYNNNNKLIEMNIQKM